MGPVGSVTYPLHTSSFGQWPGVKQQPELDDSAVRHEEPGESVVVIDHECKIQVPGIGPATEQSPGEPRSGDPEDPRAREIRAMR